MTKIMVIRLASLPRLWVLFVNLAGNSSGSKMGPVKATQQKDDLQGEAIFTLNGKPSPEWRREEIRMQHRYAARQL